MNKLVYKMFVIITICFLFSEIFLVNAKTSGIITGNGVRLRSTAESNNHNIIKELYKGDIIELISTTLYTGNGCSAGWYNVQAGKDTGYICSSYISFGTTEEDNEDSYLRPWTSPEKAIKGGALFISKSYISKGQFTSYLKKFNVNPNSSYSLYNHQYMANLAAPLSEAYTSYKSYRDNGLLSLPLEFTIPIFENMPDYTKLPESDANTSCQTEVKDATFEAALDVEEFPESYKCKLRALHETYPNWIFKALKTGIDFNTAVNKEQKVCSIQGGGKYYFVDQNGNYVETENGWYKANTETVAYYLDPRNFLAQERIIMFENLGYSDNYTETVVQTILDSTFMKDISVLDNKSYAQIFVEAGKNANISSVYLASLAKQESGSNGSRATSGSQFTYNDTTYIGLYNFFNIGAYSSESSPILAGLVWASGGNDSVIVNGNSGSVPEEIKSYIDTLNVKVTSDVITNISIGTKASIFKINYKDATIKVIDISGNEISDDNIVSTGSVVTISDSSGTYSYTISVPGDLDGNGKSTAADYVLIKNSIMGNNTEFSLAQSLAADADNNGKIGASDYVLIKNNIMK